MKVLICDDEDLARERMLRLLKEISELEILGEARNGAEALEMAERLRPDIIFLDIEMPMLNGLEVASALMGSGPAIVFVTAYDKYAIDAFSAKALDYLVKPVAIDRLRQTVEHLKKHLAPPAPELLQTLLARLQKPDSQRLALRSGAKFIIVKTAEISCIVAQNHYAELSHGTKKTLADDSLDALELRLSHSSFMRIHRQAIINLDYLQELVRQGDRKYIARLNDHAATELAVSRENLSKLKAYLGLD